jgi:hypothetical protein
MQTLVSFYILNAVIVILKLYVAIKYCSADVNGYSWGDKSGQDAHAPIHSNNLMREKELGHLARLS